ncbi:FadR/GntR family transcriptional regulator [Aporhodopirellula aestuarii]|uniref:FadR family transcriptional regulator n=1 Tax=Aporhodopirellula aestuarii TaxID=2950107 RepID=A0ABT0U2Q7_9BACT|nr:FadR/GntR family transcriptional regulator [Aporhodopirellula aestuarii]MCM2371173.1 FadR family transcriptional regulator [Aporhodopirellula aestuarii]
MARTRRNLCEQVVHDLGFRIVMGEIRVGDAIPQEWTLCEQMGVSRTVIREAIKSLAAKGLVESRAKRGTIVRPTSDWNHLDPAIIQWQAGTDDDGRNLVRLTEFRQAVEPRAAAMAAERASEQEMQQIREAWEEMDRTAGNDVEGFLAADIRFHSEIMQATGNPFFAPVANVIGASLESSLRVTNCLPSDNLSSVPLHETVLKAICDRQPQVAEGAMLSMLQDAGKRIQRAIATTAKAKSQAPMKSQTPKNRK